MKLIAYLVSTHPCEIRPANSKRAWMDISVGKNPYRCLPLSMANSWGWEILSGAKFTATWNGGQAPGDVVVEVHGGTNAPTAHFGEGTITWHTGHLFKTPYPYGLYISGAPNYPKPNVIPLSGIVETHWLPYTFTMNWKFTQPGSFTMDIGEPFCQIFPVDMNIFDNTEPEFRTLDEDKEFYDLYWDWNISRANYMTLRNVPGTEQSKPETWQKNYFQGIHPMGTVYDKPTKCPVHITEDGKKESVHRTKPNVPGFVDKQSHPYKPIQTYNERVAESRKVHQAYRTKLKQEQDKNAIAMKNAPKVGPVIERTPEEIEERVEFYENLLRSQKE